MQRTMKGLSQTVSKAYLGLAILPRNNRLYKGNDNSNNLSANPQ